MQVSSSLSRESSSELVFAYSYFARNERLIVVSTCYALRLPAITITGTGTFHPMQVELTGTSAALNAPLTGLVERTHTVILFYFRSPYFKILTGCCIVVRLDFKSDDCTIIGQF